MKYKDMILRVVIMYSFFLVANSCGQGKKMINTPPPTAEEVKKTEMSFDFDYVDFGPVQKGDTRDTVFTFTNTGTENIVIDLVTACECTTFDYPREPIAPGETGEIPITFDSSEKEAAETITIDIILQNTNPVNNYPIVYQLTYDFDIVKP